MSVPRLPPLFRRQNILVHVGMAGVQQKLLWELPKTPSGGGKREKQF